MDIPWAALTPLAPRERDIDAQGGQGLERLGANGGLGESAQLAAQDPHPGVPGGGQGGRGQDGVGDDGESTVGGQEPGGGPGGGAGVHQEGGAGLQGQPLQGRAGNGLLGRGVDLLTLGDPGLRQSGGGNRATVNLAQGAAAVQGGQVTADRLRGDVEALGELDDEDAPSTTHLLHDLAVPVLDAHVHP